MASEEKKYLVDVCGAELAACGECPVGRFDENGDCVSAWCMCNHWRTEWCSAHEYKERTCHMTHDEAASHAMCGPAAKCSECGACVPEVGTINFCPNCGARVVSE